MKATHLMPDRHSICPVPGILITTHNGAEYTGNEKGQMIRTNKDHRTKKERNRDKKLRRLANGAQ